ncbi:uncharacterized protein LOC114912133 [Scleropages formosus]|uniref:uncharacterized protein LOC114912133 n=1 Tax=Scleropages formosus TaxID=113540 RepID=UPI0010FA8110|nr:uncharacterized protein LOC114912133 [Scleropages formosus]
MIILHVALALMSNMYMTFSNDIVQPIPIKSVQLGDNVTLECDMSMEETGYVSWYKQIVGEKPCLIVTSHKSFTDARFESKFNSLHFEVKRDGAKHFLTILQAEESDSAFYYCASMRSYAAAFVTGVFLTVKGSEELQSISRTVVQQLVSDPVHPGDSVTLQCTVDSETCAGKHSVYWFRHGSGESLPGLIYTHGNRRDECEKSPEAGSPTHSCVYSLPKRNLSRSDAGIYYCAVVMCGDILFGNGTQLDIEGTVSIN